MNQVKLLKIRQGQLPDDPAELVGEVDTIAGWSVGGFREPDVESLEGDTRYWRAGRCIPRRRRGRTVPVDQEGAEVGVLFEEIDAGETGEGPGAEVVVEPDEEVSVRDVRMGR